MDLTHKKKPAVSRAVIRSPRPLTIAPIRDEDEILELVAPYKSWKPRPLADPRTASLAQVGEGLVAIIAAEGPVLDGRAFLLHTRASGLSRASRDVQATYRSAIQCEVERGRIVVEPDAPDSDALVLRPAGSRRVVVRERGDRTLDEVPLAEITALVRKLELDRGEAWASPEERFRRLLEVYELKRLTAKSRERLEAARRQAHLPEWSKAITAGFEPVLPAPPPLRRPLNRRRLRHG